MISRKKVIVVCEGGGGKNSPVVGQIAFLFRKIFLINNYFQTLKDKDIFEKMYICQVFLTMAGIILAFQLHHFHIY